MIEIVLGNILNADTQYIVHQCNCISTKAAGLAFDLFKKYSYSDVYKNRQKPDELGSISIHGNGIDQRFIINIYGQYYPGKSTKLDGFDSPNERMLNFSSALLRISLISGLKSIGFPYKIGCGLAGGNWDNYFELMKQFNNTTKNKVDIKIYQMED